MCVLALEVFEVVLGVLVLDLLPTIAHRRDFFGVIPLYLVLVLESALVNHIFSENRKLRAKLGISKVFDGCFVYVLHVSHFSRYDKPYVRDNITYCIRNRSTGDMQ